MAEKVEVTFAREKETAHTWRFKEETAGVDDAPKVGTVYLPKSTLKELGSPARIRLTIEAA